MATNEVSINVKATDAASSVFQKIGVSGESMTQKVGSAISTLGSKIGGDFGEVLSGVSATMDGIGNAGAGMGTKLAAAGLGVSGLGIAMMSLGSGEQAASQQLNQAILQTGSSVSDYSDEIDKAISKGEDFGHSGTDTKNAIAKLTEATGDAGKSISDMTLVENIAAAKHESLSAAAQQLSLAMNGNSRVFKQFGIDLGTTKPTAEQLSVAIGELSTKLSGQAAAASDTFDGKILSIKTHLGDWAAETGSKVGPAITALGSVSLIAGTAMDIMRARSASAALAQTGLTTQTAIAKAAESEQVVTTDSLTVSMEKLRLAQVDAALANERLGASALEASAGEDTLGASAQRGGLLAMGGGTAGAAGIATFAVGMYEAGNAINNFIEKNNSAVKALNNLQTGYDSLNEAFQKDGSAIGDNTKQVIQAQLQQDGLAQKAARAGISMDQLTTGVTNGDAAFSKLVATWQKSGKPSSDTIFALDTINAQMDHLKPATDAAAKSTEDFAAEAKQAAADSNLYDAAAQLIMGDLNGVAGAAIAAANNLSAYNTLAGNARNLGLGSTFASQVPSYGGQTLTHVIGHAAGGIIGAAGGGPRSGAFRWAEHGQEMAQLPTGSTVFSNPDTERALAGGMGGAPQINITLAPSGDLGGLEAALLAWMRRTIRVTGGGNVQRALGQ